MTRRLHTLTALAAIAVLTAACNPFGSTSSRERLPEDPRFAEFTYKTDGTIEVQERTDSFNERMPGLGASEGHVVAANFTEGWLLPSPDHHYWLTGVATVPDETITALMESTTSSTLLPGIYPGLYSQVPPTCQFSTVPAEHANEVLETTKAKSSSPFGSFKVHELAVSTDCHLVVVTGEGVMG